MSENTLRSALEKLTKWRTVFTGWQLGTISKENPEAQAVRNHREVTILLRAEVSALTGLLIKKGIFTIEEFQDQLEEEAVYLDKSYEQKFPGFRTDLSGVTIDTEKAVDTVKNWKP